MKSTGTFLFMLVMLSLVYCNNPGRVDIPKDGAETHPKGNRAPEATMSGPVWLLPFAMDSVAQWSAAKVTFERGSHSNWHTHPDKQVIVAVEGVGYLKIKDKPVQILHKGDVVDIPTGTLHWHGATPDSLFTQIVVNPNIEKGVVNWLDRVTAEEYKSVASSN